MYKKTIFAALAILALVTMACGVTINVPGEDVKTGPTQTMTLDVAVPSQTPDDRCNLISGENASGKTSWLEALFFLGRGRSFRTSRNELLIRAGRPQLSVTGRVREIGTSQPVGMRFGPGGIEVRLASRPVRGLAELAQRLPIQAIDPEVHRLVEGGPQERRRFVDWGVFHVEPRFVEAWRRYQRALRQRNCSTWTQVSGIAPVTASSA